jgi:hypothetical protein
MTDQQPPPPGGWQAPPGPLPGGWGPPPPGYRPPPQPPPPSSGRLVTSIIGGGLLGVLAGAFAPYVPAFLAQVFFNADIYGSGAGVWLGLAMLVTMPLGGLVGALWGMRRARRPWRPRQPIDPGHYPNRVIRRDRNER